MIFFGLGNPGSKYELTRHNVGFMLLDKLQHKWQPTTSWKQESKFQSHFIKTPEYLLAKPQTFMNRSGQAASKLISYFNQQPDELLVIHDEVDFPLGKIQFKQGGGNGGHNGLRSLEQQLGTRDFTRLRVGVGKPEWFVNGTFAKDYHNAGDFLLARFAPVELDFLNQTIFPHLEKALNFYLKEGLEPTMNKFHQNLASEPSQPLE